MNPFVRGLLIVGLVAVVVVVLQLQATLTALFLIAQIAFFLAIAFFVYLVWRERRSDIESWPDRAKWGVLRGRAPDRRRRRRVHHQPALGPQRPGLLRSC